MTWTVEFAMFTTIEVEADNKSDAEDQAAVMEDEEIESRSVSHEGPVIWNVNKSE